MISIKHILLLAGLFLSFANTASVQAVGGKLVLYTSQPNKGLVAMPSPLTSGAATIHMAALTENPKLG